MPAVLLEVPETPVMLAVALVRVKERRGKPEGLLDELAVAPSTSPVVMVESHDDVVLLVARPFIDEPEVMLLPAAETLDLVIVSVAVVISVAMVVSVDNWNDDGGTEMKIVFLVVTVVLVVPSMVVI